MQQESEPRSWIVPGCICGIPERTRVISLYPEVPGLWKTLANPTGLTVTKRKNLAQRHWLNLWWEAKTLLSKAQNVSDGQVFILWWAWGRLRRHTERPYFSALELQNRLPYAEDTAPPTGMSWYHSLNSKHNSMSHLSPHSSSQHSTGGWLARGA